PATFGEFGVLLGERTATVRAISAVQAWRIPRDRFERLARERPGLGLAIARSLATTIDQRDRSRVGAPLPSPDRLRSMVAAPLPRRSALSRIVASAVTVGIPAALWLMPAPAGLTDAGWHISLVLLVGGAVLTPLVPTVFGRVATVAPVARELSEALGYAKTSRGSAAIAFAAILGNTVLGPIFLTGIVTNFLIVALLPTAGQMRF